jgi:hypothetical protein
MDSFRLWRTVFNEIFSISFFLPGKPPSAGKKSTFSTLPFHTFSLLFVSPSFGVQWDGNISNGVFSNFPDMS